MTEKWHPDEMEVVRRKNWIRNLQMFHKKEFRNLMQSVETDTRFTTVDQVERAKSLIMDGHAMDANDAYQYMIQESTISQNKHYTDY